MTLIRHEVFLQTEVTPALVISVLMVENVLPFRDITNKICFKDQWFYFFSAIEYWRKIYRVKERRKTSRSQVSILCTLSPVSRNKEKSLMPKTLSLSKVRKD